MDGIHKPITNNILHSVASPHPDVNKEGARLRAGYDTAGACRGRLCALNTTAEPQANTARLENRETCARGKIYAGILL